MTDEETIPRDSKTTKPITIVLNIRNIIVRKLKKIKTGPTRSEEEGCRQSELGDDLYLGAVTNESSANQFQ